jgi:hypothetical protein
MMQIAPGTTLAAKGVVPPGSPSSWTGSIGSDTT